MIHFLERLELAELLRQDRNVVPDEVNIGMAGHFFFFDQIYSGLFDLLLGHVLLTWIFLSSLGVPIIFVSALFCRDNLPFHFEGAFAQ